MNLEDDEVKKTRIAHLREYEYSKECELSFELIKGSDSEKDLVEIKSTAPATDTLSSLLRDTSKKVQEALGLSAKGVTVSIKRNNKVENGNIVMNEFLSNIRSKQLDVTLLVQDNNYRLFVNAPLVRQIRLPAVIYVNFPIQPVKFNAFNTCKPASKFIWYRSLDQKQWTRIGTGYEYTATESDGGHYLKMICIPFSQYKIKGNPCEVVSENVVEQLSEFPRCPFEDRHKYTKQKLKKNEFRIVSYNILADRYVDSIRYSHCPPKALGIHYRKQLILKELEGYNADIICMQEVDEMHYKTFFKQKLEELGYKSVYHRKGNSLPEGLACFFDNNRFKLLKFTQIVLRNEVDRRTQFREIAELLNKNEAVRNEFLKQNTSLQVTVLETKETKDVIIVGNTHLFYHPDANHIRLLQMFMETTFLYSMKKIYLREHPGSNVTVVFCGDFNSDPIKSLYPAIISGTVDPNQEDCLKISENGDARMYHKFFFKSACGTPKYTNYAVDYKGCLDYIFIEQNSVNVKQSVPVPDENELSQYEGLPNEFYPSDHVSLVADLQIMSKSKRYFR